MLSWIWLSDASVLVAPAAPSTGEFQSLLSWIWLSDTFARIGRHMGFSFQSLLSWIWLSDAILRRDSPVDDLLFQSLLSWIWLSDGGPAVGARGGRRAVSILVVVDLAL